MKRTIVLALAATWLAGCSGPPKLAYPTGENRVPFKPRAASAAPAAAASAAVPSASAPAASEARQGA